MPRHPDPKPPVRGRRDPKSKALIFDPSPESQRLDRLKEVVRKLVLESFDDIRGVKLLDELDKV